MPRLLAIETSTEFGSVALLERNEILAETGFGGGITHTERLLPAISWLLESTRTLPRELQAVAVGIGPGSFTGIRIGLSTGKGIAWARGIPIVGVSSLLALASNLSSPAEIICPMIDARKGEIYWSFYRQADGFPQPLREEKASSFSEILPQITDPTVLVGTGAVRYRQAIEQAGNSRIRFGPLHYSFPRSGIVGILAWERLSQGKTNQLYDLVPRYLRKSEAELARPGAKIEPSAWKGGKIG